MRERLTQKVNFFISVSFIAVFGVFMTITVVHALNATVPIWSDLATPVQFGD
jgi:hypothetical protein